LFSTCSLSCTAALLSAIASYVPTSSTFSQNLPATIPTFLHCPFSPTRRLSDSRAPLHFRPPWSPCLSTHHAPTPIPLSWGLSPSLSWHPFDPDQRLSHPWDACARTSNRCSVSCFLLSTW
jgi:hypothetical protein